MESVKIAGMLWADIVGVLVNMVNNGTNMSVWPDVVAAPCGYWLVGEYQQTTAPSNAGVSTNSRILTRVYHALGMIITYSMLAYVVMHMDVLTSRWADMRLCATVWVWVSLASCPSIFCV